MTARRWSTNSRSSPAACPRAARCRCSPASCSRPPTAVSSCTPPTWSSRSRRASPTTVEREGEIVVPARLFTDIVRNLPGRRGRHRGRRGGGQDQRRPRGFSLNAWSASDFPQTSTFDMRGALRGRPRAVRRDAEQGGPRGVARRDAADPHRRAHDHHAATRCKMVATDSYRLAVKETKLEQRRWTTEVQAIVPVKALGEVAAAGGGDGRRRPRGRHRREPGALPARPTRAATCGSPRGSSTGSSPTTSSSFRRRSTTRSTLDKDDFTGGGAARQPAGAEERAAAAHVRGRDKLTMTALTQDVGQAEESLDVEFAGEEFEIGFNPAYLIEGIDAVDDAGRDAAVHQPAAARAGQRRGGGLRVPHHADPPEQLNDVAVSGPLPLGSFLKLAGAAHTGGHAKLLVQEGEVTRERRRRDAPRARSAARRRGRRRRRGVSRVFVSALRLVNFRSYCDASVRLRRRAQRRRRRRTPPARRTCSKEPGSRCAAARRARAARRSSSRWGERFARVELELDGPAAGRRTSRSATRPVRASACAGTVSRSPRWTSCAGAARCSSSSPRACCW